MIKWDDLKIMILLENSFREEIDLLIDLFADELMIFFD